MPTFQGILRRGLSVEGLRHFILLQGASQNTNLMEWDKVALKKKKKKEAYIIYPLCPSPQPRDSRTWNPDPSRTIIKKTSPSSPPTPPLF
ncbi:hypothetical protein T492DRAFT_533345 [Pavlovales sp. CCMP2436]|nr:hypothetical protein T492DRAFT_533345 [Pavlovales sp. CCMP2436]